MQLDCMQSRASQPTSQDRPVQIINQSFIFLKSKQLSLKFRPFNLNRTANMCMSACNNMVVTKDSLDLFISSLVLYLVLHAPCCCLLCTMYLSNILGWVDLQFITDPSLIKCPALFQAWYLHALFIYR